MLRTVIHLIHGQHQYIQRIHLSGNKRRVIIHSFLPVCLATPFDIAAFANRLEVLAYLCLRRCVKHADANRIDTVATE